MSTYSLLFGGVDESFGETTINLKGMHKGKSCFFKIGGIKHSIFLAKLPGMGKDEFKQFITDNLLSLPINSIIDRVGASGNSNVEDIVQADFTKELYEGSYFGFRNKYQYVQFTSSRKSILQRLFKFDKSNITIGQKSTNLQAGTFIRTSDVNEYSSISGKNLSIILRCKDEFKSLIEFIYEKYTGTRYLVNQEDINTMKQYISKIMEIDENFIVFDKNTQSFSKIVASKFMSEYYIAYCSSNMQNAPDIDKIVRESLKDGVRFSTMNYVTIGIENGINFNKPFIIKNRQLLRKTTENDGLLLKADISLYTTINNIENVEESDDKTIESLSSYKMITYDLETYINFSSSLNKPPNTTGYKHDIQDKVSDELQLQGVPSSTIQTFGKKLADVIMKPSQDNNYFLGENEIICSSIIITNLTGKIICKKIILNAGTLTNPVNIDKLKRFKNSDLIDQLNQYIESDALHRSELTKEALLISESDKEILIPCRDERELILSMAHEFGRNDIFFINTFNGYDFDERYVIARSIYNSCFVKYLKLSCPILNGDIQSILYNWKFNGTMKSAAESLTNLVQMAYPWKFSIDTKVYVTKMNEDIAKNDTGISVSQSLNAMLHFWGIQNENGNEAQKIEMPYTELMEIWRTRNSEGMIEVLEYCIEDSVLTYKLIMAANVILSYIERAKLSGIELKRAFFNAIGEIVGAVVYKFYWDNGIAYMDNVDSPFRANELFFRNIGGEVKCFSYGYQQYITAVDAESMYPAQKEANNVDTAAKVLSDCLINPNFYGLTINKAEAIDDVYGPRIKLYVSIGDQDFLLEDFSVNKQLKLSKKGDQDFQIYSAEAKRLEDMSALYIKPTFEYVSEIANEINKNGFVPAKYLELKLDKSNSTVFKRVFFAQNPKDPHTTVSIEYYAPKPQLLTQFRFARKDVKKILAKWKSIYSTLNSLINSARSNSSEFIEIPSTDIELYNFISDADKLCLSVELSTSISDTGKLYLPVADHLLAIAREKKLYYDTKQATFKLIMNSEYGTSDSQLFAHYDSDCPSVVTWCARQLIGFCRRSLTGRVLTIKSEYKDEVEPLVQRYNDFIKKFIVDKPLILDNELFNLENIRGVKTKDGKNINDESLYIKDFNGKIARLRKEGEEQPIYDPMNPSVIELDRIVLETDTTTQKELLITSEDKGDKITYHFLNLEMVYQDTDSNYVKSSLISALSKQLLNKEVVDKEATGKEINILTTILGYFNDFFTVCSAKNINNFPIKFSFEAAFYSAYYLGKKHYFGVKVSPICINKNPIKPIVDLSSFKSGMEVSKYFEDNNIKATGLSVIKRDTLEIVKIQIVKLMGELLNSNTQTKDPVEFVLRAIKSINRDFDSYPINAFSKKAQYKVDVKNNASAYNTNMASICMKKMVPPGTKLRLVHINPCFPYKFTKEGEMQILALNEFDNISISNLKVGDVVFQEKDVKSTCFLYKAYYLSEITSKLYEMIMPEIIGDEIEDLSSTDIAKRREEFVENLLKNNDLKKSFTVNQLYKAIKDCSADNTE